MSKLGPRRSDAEIIKDSLGDPSRFEIVFDRHYDAIRRYLARRVDPTTADDLSAEVFVCAFDGRTRFVAPDGNGSCLPWLYGIATNLMRHEFRRRERESRAMRRLVGSGRPEDTTVEVVWRLDAQRRVVDIGLVEAINGLSPDDRETFYLYAVGEASYAEVSEALGIPLGTVRSRLSRVRRTLKSVLEAATDGEELP